MPALVAFGRKWNIGSDDFVFPEITESIIRITWITFAISVFVFQFPLSCSGHHLNYHLIALFVINLVTLLLAITLCAASAKGTIMNTHSRRYVASLLHLRLPIFLIEIIATAIGTFYAFHDKSIDAGCHFTTLVKLTIALEWALIIIAIIGIFFVFNLTESELDDNGRTDRSWSRRLGILKIGQDTSMREAIDEIALLLSTFFVDLDLVFSDAVAGLLLIVHSPTNVYPPIQEIVPYNKPSWMNLKDAQYYFHHATCVYGWPTYVLYNFSVGSALKLFKRSQCCGKWKQNENDAQVETQLINMEMRIRDEEIEGQSMVLEDNCCYCNTAAVVISNEDRNVDLSFISYRNRLYEVPFAVIADHDRRVIVITIRGSCSLIDLVIDLCLNDEVMSVDVDQDKTLQQDDDLDRRGEVRVHRGMLRSARYVFEIIQKKRLLEDLFVVNPEYDLVVTGHSLGAGVASLLTLLLKQDYPNIRCYAFCPPGCVISEFGQDEMEKYVMSLVSADDVVSRLSYQSLKKLLDKVVHELNNCCRPKYTILIRGVYQLFFKYPWDDGGLSGNQGRSTDDASNLLFGRRLEEQQIDTTESSIMQESRIQLYAPGRIMYIGEFDGEAKSKWIDPKCLNEIKLTSSAFSDHFIPAVKRLIKVTAEKELSNESEPITVQPM